MSTLAANIVHFARLLRRAGIPVGPAAVVTATQALAAIDLGDRTLLPGLIDAHVHVTLGEPSSNDELFHRREPAAAAHRGNLVQRTRNEGLPAEAGVDRHDAN